MKRHDVSKAWIAIFLLVFSFSQVKTLFSGTLKVYINPIKCSTDSDFNMIFCENLSEDLRIYLMRSNEVEIWSYPEIADVIVEGSYKYISTQNLLKVEVALINKKENKEEKITKAKTKAFY